MKLIIWIKVFTLYLLIAIEKIYMIPFSNVKMSELIKVVKDENERKKLLSRFYRYTFIYGVIALCIYSWIALFSTFLGLIIGIFIFFKNNKQ